METPIFKKISEGEMRGWVRRELFDNLPSTFFEDPLSSFQSMRGEVIKESIWRWAALIHLPEGGRIFLKRDKTKDWMESVKYVFVPSRGRKEFLIASQLEKNHLNLPQPLGWMERVRGGWVRESYYLSKAIGTGVSFIDDRVRATDPHSIIELAKTVWKFQEAGLYHQDLHGGNFLWEDNSLFLTDLHHAKMVKRLSPKQGFWNLAHLFHSLRAMWGEREQVQFLNHYFKETSDRPEAREVLFQKIYPLMDRLQKRQWRSRTKRCLKESTEFTVQQERGMDFFRRRDFPLERLKRTMEQHRGLVRENPSSLIKNSPGVVVSILNDEGEKICLKQFRYPGFWNRMKEHFRRSKGLKSWVAANGMRVRGLPSLKPLALVEKKNGLGLKESFLFMEVLPADLEMDRYLLRGFNHLNQKRLFIKTFAEWLSGLHRMNCYHMDMKTCNILVSERGETWDFHLLDFEDILMEAKVSQKKLFRNFLQLNTSTPKVMTKKDRFRLFKEYLRLNPMVDNPKVFLRELLEESRHRGLVYVSHQGVVTETME